VLGTFVTFGVLVLAFVLLNHLWLLLRLPVNSNLEAAGFTRDEVLLLCSVLSSADEVAALALIKQDQYPKLSAVLFGEGVLNDAVSILLFRSILAGAVTAKTGVWAGLGLLGTAMNLLLCSTLVGLAVSLAIARFLKVNTSMLEHPTRQTIIIMLGSYVR
jgi:NhaP-type Na+/H+ or K+/H+ antiporter